MRLKVSAKWRPFCLGLNVIIPTECPATSPPFPHHLPFFHDHKTNVLAITAPTVFCEHGEEFIIWTIYYETLIIKHGVKHIQFNVSRGGVSCQPFELNTVAVQSVFWFYLFFTSWFVPNIMNSLAYSKYYFPWRSHAFCLLWEFPGHWTQCPTLG